MKKLCVLLLLVLTLPVLHIAAQDLADLETFEKAMKPGAQLTYDVTAKDKQYKLILTLKKLGDEVAFAWKTTDPENKSGNITMSNAATADAKAFFENFTGGDTKLDKETCLFISKQVANDIVTNAQASVKVKGVTDTVTVMGNTIGDFNFTINGNIVVVPGWELQGGATDNKYTVDILESSKFPLIFKMDIGYSIVLTEIKN